MACSGGVCVSWLPRGVNRTRLGGARVSSEGYRQDSCGGSATPPRRNSRFLGWPSALDYRDRPRRRIVARREIDVVAVVMTS